MLFFPNPEMPYEVAVTAWTQLMGCDTYEGDATLDAIRDFRDTYRGRARAPEHAARSRLPRLSCTARAARRVQTLRGIATGANPSPGRRVGELGAIKTPIPAGGGCRARRCVYVAAPALSSQRYMPGGGRLRAAAAGSSRRELRRPSAAARPSAAPGRSATARRRSSPRSASTSSGSPARCARSRSAPATRGGEWSEWVEAEDGNPRLLRRRRRAPAAHPRLAARRARSTTSTSPGRRATAGGLLTGAREAINSAFISAPASLAAARPAPLPPRPADRHAAREWGATLAEGRLQAARPARSTGTVKAGGHPPHRDRERLHAPRRRPGSCSASAATTATATAGTTSATTRSSTASARSTRAAPAGIKKAVVGAQAQGFNAQTTGDRLDRRPTPTTAITPGRRRRRSSTTSPGSSSVHGSRRDRQDDADLGRRRR